MRLLRWEEGRAEVDALLRTGKLEHVPASEELAGYLLEAAARHIESARRMPGATQWGAIR